MSLAGVVDQGKKKERLPVRVKKARSRVPAACPNPARGGAKVRIRGPRARPGPAPPPTSWLLP